MAMLFTLLLSRKCNLLPFSYYCLDVTVISRVECMWPPSYEVRLTYTMCGVWWMWRGLNEGQARRAWGGKWREIEMTSLVFTYWNMSSFRTNGRNSYVCIGRAILNFGKILDLDTWILDSTNVFFDTINIFDKYLWLDKPPNHRSRPPLGRVQSLPPLSIYL